LVALTPTPYEASWHDDADRSGGVHPITGSDSQRRGAVARGTAAALAIESLNGKFRDECLNEHWFITVAPARREIETWRVEYNTERPHKLTGRAHTRGVRTKYLEGRSEESILNCGL
jgi:hypothetical protein